MDEIRFKKIIDEYQKTQSNKIGTLSERTLHAVLKKYLCENEEYHEVKVGSFYADICHDGKIIEIQTRAFNKLRPKLDYFLKDHKVTICYPITHYKFLSWINLETGEVSEKRKSPKVGKFCDAFYELYKIKMYLDNPNLSIHLMLIDCDEYRNLNGWSKDKKKGSDREERIPSKLVSELVINSIDDYRYFLQGVSDKFTNEELRKSLKINIRYATLATNIFQHIGLLTVDGKTGKKNIYKIKDLSI